MASRTSKRKLTAGIAVAGVLLLSGSAFTAGNTVGDSVAGYGTSAVSGATTSSVQHALSADGTTIESTTIVFTSDLTGRTVTAGFGSAALTDCGAPAVESGGTTFTCSFTGVATADSAVFNVAVS
jgi:hypothetical protein